jgi:hypothetical protein
MLDNGKIRIQESIYTILCTALLALLQLAATDVAGYTFAPADVGKVMDRYTVAKQSAIDYCLQKTECKRCGRKIGGGWEK